MENKKTISIYEVKCDLCGEKFQGTREMLEEQLSKHIDNDCEMAKTFKDWDKKGIFKEMMMVYRREGIEGDLKKLMKRTKATPDELIEILESQQE